MNVRAFGNILSSAANGPAILRYLFPCAHVAQRNFVAQRNILHGFNNAKLRSIQRYNGGEAKVQIGPRILLKKDGSERAPAKAGRLTIEDLLWLYDIIDEVKDNMTELSGPE